MSESVKISTRQLTILATLVTIGDSILVLPAIPAFEAGRDAWISALLGLAVGLLVVYLFVRTGKLLPHFSLVELSESVLGRWCGTVLSMLFLGYMLLSISAHLREIGDFAITQILPDTPIEAILILVFLLVIMGVRYGLETFSRVAEIFFPWFILLFLVLAISLVPSIDPHKILPTLENGVKPVLRGAVACIAFPFMELVVIMMIFPNVNRSKEIGKGVMLGALVGGIILCMTIAMTILVVGAAPSATSMYPSYDLAKRINVGNFLQRIEAIMALLWIVTTYFKVTMFFYAFSRGFTQMMRLRDYRMLLLPMGMIVVSLALFIAPNIIYYNQFVSKYWPFLDMAFGVAMPLLILTVYAIRKRFGRWNKKMR